MKSFLSSVLALSCAERRSSGTQTIFAGDITSAVGLATIAKAKIRFNFLPLTWHKLINRIGNLETPVATSGKALENKVFALSCPSTGIACLKTGFSVQSSAANNHSGDYGKTAFV